MINIIYVCIIWFVTYNILDHFYLFEIITKNIRTYTSASYQYHDYDNAMTNPKENLCDYFLLESGQVTG